ncbi:MAG: THUMP domain-containing protein [Nanoarchaeota archaeon]
MTAYIAVTTEGIEDICEAEVMGKKIAPARVKFMTWKEDVKSANIIFELIKKARIDSIDEIQQQCEDLQLSKEEKYKVECNREGDHPFRSVDVEREIGIFLREKGFIIDREQAKQTIYIDIIKKVCFIGLLKKERLCRRAYRVKINNQGISGCLGYAMLKIAEYDPETEGILDPLCKDGTIAIEAARMGGKNVRASDPLKNNIRNARINMQMAKAKIEMKCQELQELEQTEKENSIDLIATRIVLSKENNKSMQVWKGFFRVAKKIAKRIIIMTNTDQEEKDIANKFRIKEKRKIQRGGALEYIYLLEKKDLYNDGFG